MSIAIPEAPLFGKEPDPNGPRVRRFLPNIYPGHLPNSISYKNLAEIRRGMVEDDRRLINSIGSRLMVDFHMDPATDSSKTARQLVGSIAEQLRPGHLGFPEMIEAIYEILAAEDSPFISITDDAILAHIAARTEKAMAATLFKVDRGEGIAPAQQAINLERAVAIAKEPSNALDPMYGDFPSMVRNVYAVLVPTTANVLQQDIFRYTAIDDWDAGLAAAFSERP